MQIAGKFVKAEHRKGDFTPDDAEIDPATGAKKIIAYDFHLVHVFDGESIIECRLPEGVGTADLPFRLGDEVSFSVDVPKNVKFRVNEVALMQSLEGTKPLHVAAG